MDRPARLAQLQAALFHSMGPDGVWARTGLYEGVLGALTGLIDSRRPAEAEVYRFPPVMSRGQLETSGYLKSFPHLLGCVCCLDGSERDIRQVVNRFAEGGSWTEALAPADLVLTPASCYPIYPIALARGPAPARGWTFDVGCDCFRREPSRDLDRMQSFRMREFVRIGSADQIMAFRQAWIAQAQALAAELGLVATVEIANDPFFGRGGQMMADIQREENLKFELLAPVISDTALTACMSFNDHQDHFGKAWGLRLHDGAPARTGCVAFGMDRITLALFARHGLDVGAWPVWVREALAI